MRFLMPTNCRMKHQTSYDLVIGGVLSATLVPVFTSLIVQERRSDDDERGFHAVVSAAILASTVLAVLAVALAPLIFRCTPHHRRHGRWRHLSIGRNDAHRLFVIQVLFYGITGVMTAILHSLRRFLAAAWAPVASNVIIIATLLTLPGAGSTTWRLSDVTTDTRFFLTLGLGATGDCAHGAHHHRRRVPHLVGLKWHLDLRHPSVARAAKMSGWTLGFVLANRCVGCHT